MHALALRHYYYLSSHPQSPRGGPFSLYDMYVVLPSSQWCCGDVWSTISIECALWSPFLVISTVAVLPAAVSRAYHRTIALSLCLSTPNMYIQSFSY